MPKLLSFILINFIMITISGFAWKFRLIASISHLPEAEYLMMGFLGFQWLLGLIMIGINRLDYASFFANSLPIWGLICLGLNIFNSIQGAPSIDVEAAGAIVKAAGMAILINSFGVFLMLWLKKLAFFMRGEDI